VGINPNDLHKEMSTGLVMQGPLLVTVNGGEKKGGKENAQISQASEKINYISL